MVKVLTEGSELEFPGESRLWLEAEHAREATGWELEPEGMCRDEICVPLPKEAVRGSMVDVEAFWQKLGNPVVSDEEARVFVLGQGAAARNSALEGLMAPDFTLPDLGGVPHRLSNLRGQKVFLTTWASW